MQATEILMNEHRTIEQVLSALEGMAIQAKKESRLDLGHAKLAVEFIRNFADKFHHAKEEDLLFAEMEAVGFPRHGGPIAVMLQEHDLGRGLVRKMAESIEPAASGDAAALRAFADAGCQFAALLRAHIQKEDQILYPMADEALSAETQSALLESFAQAEQAHGGQTARDGFAQAARQLTDLYARYAPPASASPAGGTGCGHGC